MSKMPTHLHNQIIGNASGVLFWTTHPGYTSDIHKEIISGHLGFLRGVLTAAQEERLPYWPYMEDLYDAICDVLDAQTRGNDRLSQH